MPQRLTGLSTVRTTGAVLLAALLCLVALPTMRADAAPESVEVTGGTISWGLKSSFRGYLTSPIAHGSVTPTAPATDNGTQTIFANASGSWSDDELSVSAAGSVNFTGHDGELAVTLSNPRLAGSGSSAQLVVDAKDSDGVNHSALAIADVDLSGRVQSEAGTVTISGAPATLTSAGEAVFSYGGGAMYPAGTALDPVDASLTIGAPVTEPTPEPTTEPTTEPTSEPTAEPTTAPTVEPTTEPTSAPSADVTGGTISWGLKSSFRGYLTSPIAQGSISATAPATDNGTQTTFAHASGSWAAGSASVSAEGSVNFTGHHGDLDLTLSNPRLVVSGSGAQLHVDAKDSDGTTHEDLAIADVDLAGHVAASGTTVTVSGAPATLTQAGGAVFSYGGSAMYPAGTALDPVDASLILAEPSTEPTTQPTTAPTSQPTTQPTSQPTTQPTTGPTTQPTTPAGDVTGGTITWGLKESFRTYLTGPIAHGRITVQAPATDNGSRTTFRSATGTWSSTSGNVSTSGGVNFTGHHGDLNLTISAPRIAFNAKVARLLVDAKTSDGTTYTGLAVANLDLSGSISVGNGKVTISNAPATLTKAGESLFNYNGSAMYPAGTVLDPVSATLNVKNAVVPTTPKPSKKPTPTKTAKPKPSKGSKKSETKGHAGALSWGFKASFRSYITGPIAKGSVSLSGGASAVSGGYRFGQGSTTATPPNAIGTTGYRGGVQFHGHQGELNLSFSQPTVRVTSATSGVLSAQVAGRGKVDLAIVDLSRASRATAQGWVQYSGAPAALTAAGSGLFSYNGNAFYPAGSLVDPVTFSVGSTATGGSSGATTVAAAATTTWTPPATPPATTGLTVTQDDVRAGDEIEVSGSGFTPNESGIRVVLYSAPMVLADNVTADATGKATWKGTIPATIEPGEHTLTFQGSVDRGIVLQIGKAEQIIGCQVTDGQLYWGFKESFRAYVSGSIANGDWTTDGNASYETPQFAWAKGEGARAGDTGAGSIDFTGGILFSGHSGALKTTIADPVVTFTDTQKAVLSVDYSGTTMEEAMSGGDAVEVKKDVPFVDLDLASGVATSTGSSVTIADIPTTLTTAGATVFPNYEAGTAFDPVTLTFTVDENCSTGAPPQLEDEDEAAAAVVTPTSGTASGDRSAWLPWVGGALLGAAAACAGTVLFMRRRVTN